MFEFKPPRVRNKLIYGVATNDADYATTYKGEDGRLVTCPIFSKWNTMLFRCFDKTVKTVKFPSYRDCTVHPDWLLFSNFRRWMLLQDWEGKVLDKDILVRGNKEYGPLTCMMVTPAINSITTFSDAARGQWPLGVSKTKINGVYYFIATLSYYGKQKRLGYFKNPEDASACYLKAKNAHIQKLADEEPDEKVASALRKWVIT